MKSLYLIIKVLIFSSIHFQLAHAHAPSRPAQCKEIVGIREMQDFKADGTEFVNFTKTPLYSAQSDETFFHFFAMSKALERKLSPVVKIDILNSRKAVIKSFKFDKWEEHSNYRELSYAKFNFQKLIKANLAHPFDVYINLEKPERDKIPLAGVPYSAQIEIVDSHGKVLCNYNYAYGANYH